MPSALPLQQSQKPSIISWRGELRATLSLAWPLILTNLTMALIGATDVLMLGWLGAEELAASSLGFQPCNDLRDFLYGFDYRLRADDGESDWQDGA